MSEAEQTHPTSSPDTETPVIEIQDLTKTYQMGETLVHALRSVSLSICEGEYVAIIGTSGSGKSTLMNMIGLLDRPTSGSYRIRGTEASKLSKNRMADLRNREIGFIFQRFNLLARTDARRQVELPLFYAGIPPRRAGEMAVEALSRVGLGDRTHHKPDELSGGQQQRVAIARALVNAPSLLLADEPTGALDTKTGRDVLLLFRELNESGITLVVVTHDMEVARQAGRIITLRDGRIISDEPNVPPPLPTGEEHDAPEAAPEAHSQNGSTPHTALEDTIAEGVRPDAAPDGNDGANGTEPEPTKEIHHESA